MNILPNNNDRRSGDKMSERILGTTRNGKVKIYSKNQMDFLHQKKIPHTHYKYSGGKIVKKSKLFVK